MTQVEKDMLKNKIFIRNLRKGDSLKLEGFFKKLSPDIFVLWNRFGFSLHEFNPKKIAEEVCAAASSKEKGFICLDPLGDIVAYSYLRFFPKKITKKHNASLGIVVNQFYQGCGLGKRLMLYMHDWAKKNKLKKIWLATYSHNKKSLSLYKRLGYEIEGIFMYDELTSLGWAHVVSMALMLDKDLSDSKKKRRRLIEEVEKSQF